eukprot:CAMPEP_0174898980 /NCGR_PEP_ID=MMETSP0167-20121228/24785_1 /TAXON_ID=38298 /ORGANISM="Rhodella maculata, Strain CCMP736" /LENGTH=53 /DNA_ID=CAMNT_0016139805 /DNA_START=191 /DNA_END=349 /DNA_ORIENTATION=-
MRREVGHKIQIEMQIEMVVCNDGQAQRTGDYNEEETNNCVDVSIVHVKNSCLI